LSAYVGKIHGALQRAKVSAAGGGVGQVTLGFTIDARGKVIDLEVIKSSGVAKLDEAALSWLERADFPPLPGVLGTGQRFNVPLTFKRKSG
jgi:periplasmic protein TonB